MTRSQALFSIKSKNLIVEERFMRHFRFLSVFAWLLAGLFIVSSVYAHPQQQADEPGLRLEAGGSITITLNRATTTRLDATGFGLTCQQAGAVGFTLSGSGDSYVITPSTALIPGDVCTITVFMDGSGGER